MQFGPPLASLLLKPGEAETHCLDFPPPLFFEPLMDVLRLYKMLGGVTGLYRAGSDSLSQSSSLITSHLIIFVYQTAPTRVWMAKYSIGHHNSTLPGRCDLSDGRRRLDTNQKFSAAHHNRSTSPWGDSFPKELNKIYWRRSKPPLYAK